MESGFMEVIGSAAVIAGGFVYGIWRSGRNARRELQPVREQLEGPGNEPSLRQMIASTSEAASRAADQANRAADTALLAAKGVERLDVTMGQRLGRLEGAVEEHGKQLQALRAGHEDVQQRLARVEATTGGAAGARSSTPAGEVPGPPSGKVSIT